MTRTFHERSLEEAFYKAITKDPQVAACAAEARTRIIEGGFYSQDVIDASFQKWEGDKQITLIDAYGFLLIWSHYLSGEIACCSVPVPSGPHPDREIEANQKVLDQLPSGFRATFTPERGGGAESDGSLTIPEGIGLWRTHAYPVDAPVGRIVTVAALYIDPRGPYANRPGVDAWDEKRDARLYDGPWPVVAHPPCGPWSSLRHLWTRGQRDCGPRAVEHVQRFGGVLEHPAYSRLWEHCRLPKPGEGGRNGGVSYEVQQCDWGHPARKRTWLYVVGLGQSSPTMPPRREPTHWCSGGGTGRGKTPPGIKVCSAQQRRRTPPAFADWLIALAEQAGRVRGA
jgi:hypothetical protein